MSIFPVAQRTRIILVIGVVVVCGILLYLLFPKSRQIGGDQPSDVILHTTDSPSEQPISQAYSVDYGQPLSIELSSIDTKGYIQKVGIDQKQAVAAPNNIHLAGWFVDSVLPGEKGLSIIDGHEGGPSMDGIFKKLPQVRAGDTIIVTMGGGQRHTYEIFTTKTIPNTEAAAVLFEQDPTVKGQLNLITCTGRYNASAQTYEDRFIVYAKLLAEQ